MALSDSPNRCLNNNTILDLETGDPTDIATSLYRSQFKLDQYKVDNFKLTGSEQQEKLLRIKG